MKIIIGIDWCEKSISDRGRQGSRGAKDDDRDAQLLIDISRSGAAYPARL